jgi:hypothetical protein
LSACTRHPGRAAVASFSGALDRWIRSHHAAQLGCRFGRNGTLVIAFPQAPQAPMPNGPDRHVVVCCMTSNTGRQLLA